MQNCAFYFNMVASMYSGRQKILHSLPIFPLMEGAECIKQQVYDAYCTDSHYTNACVNGADAVCGIQEIEQSQQQEITGQGRCITVRGAGEQQDQDNQSIDPWSR